MFESENEGSIDRRADVIVATDGIQRRLKAGDVLGSVDIQRSAIMVAAMHQVAS